MSEKKNEVENEEVKNDGLAINKEVANEVVKSEDNNIKIETFDLTSGMLPDLNSDIAQALPFDLMADYWTPEKENEEKRLFFQKLGLRDVLDKKTGEVKPLLHAFFVEQIEDGSLRPVTNASKRLVGALESNGIDNGSPLLVIYRGKKKNKTNEYSSDTWSIFPLIVKVKAK